MRALSARVSAANSVGKGVAVIVMHYVVGAAPPEVKFAIEYLIEAACTIAGGYIGGYWQKG